MRIFLSVLASILLAVEANASDLDSYFIEGTKWEEATHKVPAYPKESELLQVVIDAAGAPFEFFIDKENLSVGGDDVIHYTLLIRSFSGASNVMHEGIRCETSEFKTYAFGAADGRFIDASEQTWQFIGSDGINHYRQQLAKYYFCHFVTPYKKEQIIDNIIYRANESHPEGDDY